MEIFWVSWWQKTEDYRPITYPPNKGILGWWCSGMRCQDEANSIWAMVIAENLSEVKNIVIQDWPEAEEWRFCDEVENTTLSDRFHIKDWMEVRIESFNNQNPVPV